MVLLKVRVQQNAQNTKGNQKELLPLNMDTYQREQAQYASADYTPLNGKTKMSWSLLDVYLQLCQTFYRY